MAILAIGVLAAAGGLLLKGSGTGRAPPPPISAAVTRGALTVKVPSGWTATGGAARLPGVTFPRPIVLVNRHVKVRVIAGLLHADSQTLLPAGFVRGMQTELPTPDRVRIGGALPAYHYAGLSHPGVGSLLDVYVAPTTEGLATAACLADAPASLLDDCWRAVSRLSLTRGRSLPLDPAAAFRDALRVTVGALNPAEGRARRGLSLAMTPHEQASAVAPLPAAYRRAAASLAPLGPGSVAWPSAILGTLRRTGAAYGAFERALSAGDADAFARAARTVRARRAQLGGLVRRAFRTPRPARSR